MSDKKEQETPEPRSLRIDMRALERGVRKALAINPRDSGREQGKEPEKQPDRQDKEEGKAP
ncbi:MAG: hypothetical protein OXL39_10305 [Caldilineaceae bacterium]|nr:hypothetical protein [Caldilineaceae bacterium]